MASAASIGRNVGGSLPRVAAAMASAVIGLPTGPTDMMTSTLLSRIADETLFGSNWITLILPASLGLSRSSADSITIWSGADVVLPQDHLEQLDVARRCARPRRAAGRPGRSVDLLDRLPWPFGCGGLALPLRFGLGAPCGAARSAR